MNSVALLRATIHSMLVEAGQRQRARGSRRVKSIAGTFAKIIAKYPRIVARSKKQSPASYGEWDAVVTSRNPVAELEKLAVYDTMTSSGGDVSYVRVSRLLPKIRQSTGRHGILGLYELDKLRDVLETLGMLKQTSEVGDDTDTYL